jgi:hypothetical protein
MHKKSKDLTAPALPATAQRVRVSLGVYVPKVRQFRYVPGSYMVTCRDAAERHRLWAVVKDAIERGDWRESADVGSVPDAAGAGAGG